MTTVDAQEAMSDLNALLAKVEQGEIVIIAVNDRPVAELRPTEPMHIRPRPFGLCRGEFTVPDNFDDPLPAAILADFEN